VGHVLQMVRDQQVSSRADIARATGLARSTVSQRVEVLLELGLLLEEEESSSTGGRPPTRLRFNSQGGIVLAADVGATHISIAVTDLDGSVLASDTTELPIIEGPDVVLGWVREHFEALLQSVGRQAIEVRGIGIGVPGPVEFAHGRVVNPPIMPGWDGFAIPAAFAGSYPHVPVLVDNDVNIMAIGEYWSQWRHNVENLVYIKVATGIGAGIITGGHIYRGAQGAAGDIGHVQVSDRRRDADEARYQQECSCGNVGCVEAVASGTALARQLTEKGFNARTTRDVVSLVKAGNLEAIRQVREAGRDIGSVLAHLVNFLNPAVVVVGGDLSNAQEPLFAGIREVVYRRSTALATGHLQMMKSRLGDTAGVTGAAVMVLEQCLSPEAIDRLALEASA
jgi:predicted NBD/HSP70 family sugar kinase